MEQKRKEIESLEKRLSVIRFIAISLCVIMVFSSSWLAKNVFAYEIEETKTVKEPYQYVVGTVSTYVCYTTDYGDKYHARGCGYLWKSSNQTTVYQAEKNGYAPCSQCTPTQKTTLEITEKRYREVERTVTITEEPKLLVLLIGLGTITLIYYVSTIGLKKRIDELKTFEKVR